VLVLPDLLFRGFGAWHSSRLRPHHNYMLDVGAAAAAVLSVQTALLQHRLLGDWIVYVLIETWAFAS
jgi:hypothetical protein